MISGINLEAVTNYTCKEDKENPTIWKIGPLPNRKLSVITDQAALKKPTEQLIELTKFGLKGWENFKVADKDVVFKADKNGLDESILDIIPIGVVIELGTAILGLHDLTGREIKN